MLKGQLKGVMEQRPLEYTVKIYCEGFTELYYFEWLRTNNRFKFSMEPDIPKNSRSSYKQNLKLIDKDFAKLHSIAETAMKNGNSKFNAILAVVQQ